MTTKASPAAINNLVDSAVVNLKAQIAALDWSVPVPTPVPTPTPTPTPTPAPGNYTVSKPISLSGVSNQVITGLSIIGGSGPCISLNGCSNIHITLCKIYNSTSQNGGIFLVNCQNITIDFNFITNCATGVYATDSPKGGIVVDNNQFLNMQGPLPRGQYVQFNNVQGPGCSVSNNKGENIFGSSNPEDAINIYMSSGTAASPIQIVGNMLRGGGPSTTGGGIMLGDNGGSYQYAANNILVNPGQYGMAIAGGDHIQIVNNQVYAAQKSFTNVGIYVWGQSGSKITNATVSGNQVTWTNSFGENNPDWLATGEATPAGWSTNNWSAKIDATILPATIITLQ